MVNREGEGSVSMKRSTVMMLLWLALAAGAAPAAGAPVSNWVQTDRVQFTGADGFFRSQGVASDGETLFFSWNLGLSRTEIDDTSVVLADNTTGAIPTDLADTNHNHIGDIDVSDGIIYAPIEDGPAHKEPWIVLYDADTLQPTGDRYLLPVSVQRDGVPWIAVDKPRGVAYSMEWNDTGKLFVYRLQDFQLVRTVNLSQPVPRIQGAKMFRGLLYASRDNGSEQSVVAIDTATGEVTHLFDRNLGNDYEAEGIAFVRRASGTLMVATGIRQGANGYTDMRIYRINGDSTPPVLSQVTLRSKRVYMNQKPVVSFRSSEDATVSIRWQRCVGEAGKPCDKTVGSGAALRVQSVAGNNRVVLKSKRVGKWQIELVPVDSADVVGAGRKVALTVVRSRQRVR